ncbi:hypothetical protein CYLTODRAFT_493865 [Cylindrobasidium torrendii FP15055 ss-10]|uniref:Uncharacterized protein n=1 Tax=Cylindrobasidium torrendii FP15055 ss-10 TaxID=1314674 RepID=A0A0D7B013_9AGAR|nr:hypothetical protein CYLTODRAFT_493865 [Cylindrobasidium torrendii FP15055 ss-10]
MSEPHPTLPSEVVHPTRTDTAPQQGATQPGSGGAVHQDNVNVVHVPAEKPPFKERVVGAALQTRGTILGKPELKETGQQLFDGDINIQEAREAVKHKKD